MEDKPRTVFFLVVYFEEQDLFLFHLRVVEPLVILAVPEAVAMVR